MHQGPDGSLHAVAKDITERYEQQALATRRTEQLNDAQRLAQMGSWETDFASGCTRSRRTCARCSPGFDLITGRRLPLPRAPGGPRAHAGGHGERGRDGDTTGEFRVLLPDGRVRAFTSLVRPVCDAAGTLTGLRGTVKDVTETRRAEADLRRSEERFRQGFDNAPIAMALVDPASLRFLRVNDAFCTMVGPHARRARRS